MKLMRVMAMEVLSELALANLKLISPSRANWGRAIVNNTTQQWLEIILKRTS